MKTGFLKRMMVLAMGTMELRKAWNQVVSRWVRPLVRASRIYSEERVSIWRRSSLRAE